jgi:ferrochelatase
LSKGREQKEIGSELPVPRRDEIAVVLMTYGSPKTLSDIPSYLRNVRGGREADESLIAEFRRRYELIGGSPLLRITTAQAIALEKELNETAGEATRYRVVVGMRYAPPFVGDVVSEVAKNTSTIVGIVMSPQYSPTIMGGYVRAISEAVAASNRQDLALRIAREWHVQPQLIEAFGDKVRTGLERFDATKREKVQVLMTAHSMPKRVVDNEPQYLRQLRETAAAVAKDASISEARWSFCYQSAGHTPEEWLKPDFADVMPALRASGCRGVLVAPIQFVADHLETLYDIDIAARAQAEAAGIEFARTDALNDTPLFIKALAGVVARTLSEAPPTAAVPSKV